MGPDHKVGEMTDVDVAAERLCLWAHMRHPRGAQATRGPVSALSPSRVTSPSLSASVFPPVKWIEGVGRVNYAHAGKGLVQPLASRKLSKHTGLHAQLCLWVLLETRACTVDWVQAREMQPGADCKLLAAPRFGGT